MMASKQWRLGVLTGLVVGVLLAVGVGYYYSKDLSTKLQQQSQELSVMRADLTQAQLQNQTLETQRSLDQATQEALEQSLRLRQDEVSALNERLAFYEQLLPLADKSTVNIRAIDLTEQSDDLLHYRLLLQRPAGLDTFNGHIQFTAHGQQAGSSVTMILNTAGSDPVDSAAIQFDQFLRKTGLLAIPPDLKIDAVTLHIYQGKKLLATHKVNLSLK